MVEKIDEYVKAIEPVRTQTTYFSEVFRTGIEFESSYTLFNKLKKALEKNKKKDIQKAVEALKDEFADVHNKDYDHEVDRKVAKVLIPQS